ncbi:hypothetical protein BN946_scf184994.g31 [Trametes cinnabarina]|uniref:Glycosyltransferase Family 1 protein n=1 Tax=Pycnoporus cinnabarinus TaxID=5643 RepID=A0A060SK25_PYCCI|nr:hypothetical protein BN946_scf184994.g31 [Trametes cinnabarina]
MNFFAVSPIATIKGTSGNLVKVYIWYPAMTAAVFMMFGPEKYDGPGCVRIRAEEEAKKTGRPLQEVTYDLLFTPKGKVLSYPGLPLITDYEMHPQDFPVPPEVANHIVPRLHEIVESSDGMLLTSPASYEPEAVEAVSAWLGETGRPVYVCGPLLPAGSKAVSNEKKQSRQGAEITAFLDQTLQTSGERSLLYISFGSVFWPLRTPEKLWAFLDVVMELGIPSLLSHASPFAGDLPEEIVKKVKMYGKGFLSVWTPQQSVLQHPATGWFVTHCGHNSIIESISAGVPICVLAGMGQRLIIDRLDSIAWPFHADQGFNAIRVIEVLKVGYELIEVRTGHGLHPLHRNGREPVGTSEALRTEAKEVLANAFGEDGTRKREKLLMLTRSFQHEWDEGGRAWNDVHAFLDRLWLAYGS